MFYTLQDWEANDVLGVRERHEKSKIKRLSRSICEVPPCFRLILETRVIGSKAKQTK